MDTSNMIFVFGSNTAGRHGAGAAQFAREHRGAIHGMGLGLHGQSYAIPTKDAKIRTLPVETVGIYVNRFLSFAREHPELSFQVTAIGCGLAGYQNGEIAPMFEQHSTNCFFDKAWKSWLPDSTQFWGRF